MNNFPKSSLTRRHFLVAAGAVTAGCLPALAEANPQNLFIDTRSLDVKGRSARVFGIQTPQGRSGLDLTLGRIFDVSVENRLGEETLLHWHGLTPPTAMDGVPMLSGPLMKPGERRGYSFPNTRAGTHWMHSHFGLQEQRLLAAPLIIREDAEPLVDEQEHVIMLHDFTFRDPQEILEELQGGGGAHAGHSGQQAQTADSGHAGHGAKQEGMMAASMNDVVFDAMLANDRTLDDPEVVKAEKGGRFRLRIINACAATNLWVDLGDIEGELIAVDGNAVYPVKGKQFPLAIAQRADIRLALPPGSGAFPILFQSESVALRSGIILQSGDGQVTKLSDQGEPGRALDLEMEAGLRSVAELPDEPVVRTEMVMLTGGGADYIWGLNGKPSMHDVLFTVREGERLEVMMHNMTNMAHPMHLHGHYFKVTGIGNRKFDGAVRDTIHVPAGETVTIRFDADNPGTWAFHCHHLYHMNSGMMGAIAYTSAA
jgi:FtsP/CotA-like multicopper oxidase with cupredoxin domain